MGTFMTRFVALIPLVVCALTTGCNNSSAINCDTPEVKRTEIDAIESLATLPSLQVESSAQFTDRKTGNTSCAANLSFIYDGNRVPYSGQFIFALNVADDNKHFTVELTSWPQNFEQL